ncbi:hypothetical protein [Orenia marismortui]|uniref:hypothetical protein n=1 Tax=Orenia marismortui TaxID=46469 RepID=UPI000373BA7C|nr:hypothetical protein [Orenia marismortui]
MEQWIRDNFEIIENSWKNKDDIHEDAFEVNGKTLAPISFFIDNFSVELPVTLEKLKAKDPDDKLGWYNHFKDWQEKGII